MDWTVLVVAAVAAGPPTVMAWLAVRKASHATEGVARLHIEVNDRLTQLIAATTAAAGAAGEQRGREQARQEHQERKERP